jgi:hypothetical protein
MKKESRGLLFVLGASLLLSMLFIPPFNPISGDKEIYRYIARVMVKGGVPYRDVFDHKPPLIYFLNYAAILLGGDWGQWIIDTALALLSTGMFYRLCRRNRLSLPWLPPLLFNLMIRNFLMCLGMGMTREYTSMFLLIFFCIVMGEYRFRYLLMGFVSGLIFFMQQDQVLALIPFFLYAFLFSKSGDTLVSRMLQTAAGFGAVALLVLGYFAVHHALGDLWQDAFRFNMTWYTTTLKETAWDHWRKLKATLDQGNYELPAMVGLTLGLSGLVFHHTNKRLLLLSLAAVFLSISTEFMGGRDVRPRIFEMGFTHYFLPLSASIPILLFVVFAFTREPMIQSAKAQVIYAVLLCSSLFYTNLQHAFFHHRTKDELVVTSPEMQYIRQQRPGDHQLYVFFDNNSIYTYNELGIVGPSRWVYQHFWELYDNWDNDHSKLLAIEQELLDHHTQYIMNYATMPRLFRDPAGFDHWHSFLLRHYDRVPLNDPTEGEVWKLKEAQSR